MREARFTKPLSVPFTPEAYKMVEQLAREQDISMAHWIRKAVNKVIAQEKEKDMKVKRDHDHGRRN